MHYVMEDVSERHARSDPNEEIMRATYRALCEHGYVNLTIKRIAEEYGKSTAAIHYHYDTKDELLVSFLDHLLDRFTDTIHEVDTTDPERRLDLLLDKLLTPHEDQRDLLVALLEMQSQAPYKDTFEEQFQQNDEYLQYVLETVISHGIKEDAFADADAEHAARSLVTIVYGAQTRTVVVDDRHTLAAARRTADEYVAAVLLQRD